MHKNFIRLSAGLQKNKKNEHDKTSDKSGQNQWSVSIQGTTQNTGILQTSKVRVEGKGGEIKLYRIWMVWMEKVYRKQLCTASCVRALSSRQWNN